MECVSTGCAARSRTYAQGAVSRIIAVRVAPPEAPPHASGAPSHAVIYSLQAQILNPKSQISMSTPNEVQQFILHWAAVELNERAVAQSHFNALCKLLGLSSPVEADPKGQFFRFEKPLTKAGGKAGFADVWYKPSRPRPHMQQSYNSRKGMPVFANALTNQYAGAIARCGHTHNSPCFIIIRKRRRPMINETAQPLLIT